MEPRSEDSTDLVEPLEWPHAASASSLEGPRNLVAPPPWTGYNASDPLHKINKERFPQSPSPLNAVTGNATVLVILIKFSDVSNSSSHTPAYFENLLFNTSQNSMAKYFADNSFNTFNVSGTVTSKFYTANNTEAWYGTYEFSSPPASGYGNAQNLTLEAVLKADADIDYSKFDKDGDGYVDHLVIVHSGKDDANDGDYSGPAGDPQMWSHAWAMSSVVYLDGVKLYYYTMLSEDDPMGVYAHEFGHDIGLPDLYDTDYSSDGGVGKWDLMASGNWNNGGATPAMLSAWCKIQLGWVSPTVVNSDSQGLEAKRAEDNAVVYKVWVNFSNKEYFLIENRQQTGFDASLPGNGLLIWHVNDSAPNNNRDAYRLVDLEEADDNNKASDPTDPWKSNATGFTPTSSPNTNDYSGKNTGIRIYNISASGNTMTFDVDLGNSPPSAPTPVSPSDGAWTNKTKPALNWTFSDSDPGDSQTAYRVQVDDDSGFGSPLWDSGDVVSSANGTAVGTDLGEGKWYWRVRTRDSGGLWSGYSPARSLNVDLTAPAAPSGVTVSPSGWSAVNSFTIDWVYPSESGTSGIEPGVYYRLDSAPASPTDGTWSPSKPLGGITVTGSGAHTIYLWLRDKAGNVNHENRTSATLYLDQLPPSSPSSLTSPTHAASSWSNRTLITIRWSGASDQHSGVSGFSYLWDGSPATFPDATADCDGTACELNSTIPADGAWYFHIRAVDGAGNWATEAAHLGPFLIDTIPPSSPRGASSPSHTPSVWSNLTTATVQWWGASDSGSGLAGYSLVWDNLPDALPDAVMELDASATSTTSPPLADSDCIYFHIRAVDRAGNWNETALHFGPLYIDTVPPANPGSFEVLSGHSIGGWSRMATVTVAWSGFSDSASGADGFSILWDTAALSSPDFTKELEEDGNWSEITLISGRYYLHIRAVDRAGNWNQSVFHIGPFLIDLLPPGTVAARDDGDFTGSPRVVFSWEEASDELSGVAGYIVSIGTSPGAEDVLSGMRTSELSYSLEGALDGVTYYLRVKAVDLAGNEGAWGAESDGITVDLSAPGNLSVSINGGSVLTADPRLLLQLAATDAVSGPWEMRFSMDARNWTNWIPFATEHEMTLTPGDGERSVFFQVRDRVGNEASPVSATIILDTTGPVVTRFEVSGGITIVNSTDLLLIVEAEDAISGVAFVRLSNDGSLWSDWMDYAAHGLPWSLEGGDGKKSVFVQVRDGAGNDGAPSVLEVTLDTTPPRKPSISSSTHPRRETWYNVSTLELRWSAVQDPSGVEVYGYELAREGSIEKKGELNATSIGFELGRGGVWVFRLRAKDGAGNWGEWAELEVLVDTEGPAPPHLELPENGARLPLEPVVLRWGNSMDPQSGLRAYYLEVDETPSFDSPLFAGVVEGCSHTLELSEGTYHWRVRALDAAGNRGAWSEEWSFVVSRPGGIGTGHPSPFSLSGQLLWLLIAVMLAIAVAAAAGLLRRKRGEPPGGSSRDEGAPRVSWEEGD
ncbi:MAG: M6 family metalloprotease domain-containing protein [Thermoplasmata archaeon]